MLIWVYAIILACLAGVITPLIWFAYFKGGDFLFERFAIHTGSDFSSHIVILPLVIGIVVFCLFYLARAYRSADGFTYFISDLHFEDGRRKLRYSLMHGFSSFLMLIGGGIVGGEAFCLEVLTALGSRLGILSKLSTNQVRTLAACGAVSAIAAILGIPSAAFLFVVELLYGWGNLSAAVGLYAVSAFVAASVSRSLTSPGGLLGSLFGSDAGLSLAIRTDNFDLSLPGIAFSLGVVSIAAALLAALTIWLYRRTDGEFHSLFETRRSSDVSPQAFALRVGLWAVLTAVVFGVFNEVLGVGTNLLHDSLSEGFLPSVALIALVLRLLLGVLSYCVFGSMGLIFPALVEGGLLGACLALFFGKFFAISAGSLALLSMGAYFSAVFGTPVAGTALVFGYASGVMSDSAVFLFTSLATNFAASYLCGRLQTDRLAAIGLYRHGIRFRNGMCFNTLSSIEVRDAMITNVKSVPRTSSIGEAYKQLMDSKHAKLPVVDAEGKFHGVVSLSDFYGMDAWKKIGDDAQIQSLVGVEEMMKDSPALVRPTMNLEAALTMMSDEELVPVVDDAQLYCGILLRSDLVNLYNKEVVKKAFRR